MFSFPNSLRNRVLVPVFAALALSLLTATAQERARERADDAVWQLLREKSASASWSPDPSTVWGDKKARFYDPNDPDNPPQPKDDPKSNALMRLIDGKRGATTRTRGARPVPWELLASESDIRAVHHQVVVIMVPASCCGTGAGYVNLRTRL